MTDNEYTQLPLFPPEPPPKRCTVCQQLFPATTDYFHKNPMGDYGLYSRCKECCNAIRRGDLVIIRAPDGYKRCSVCKRIKPLTSEYFNLSTVESGEFRCLCRECQRIYKQRYDEINHEALREREREYYWQNQGMMLERKRIWRINNPDKVRLIRSTHYWTDVERVRAVARDWARRNRDKQRATRHRYWARARNLPNTFTGNDYNRMMDYWGWSCAISGEAGNINIDHWIPLASPDCPGTIPVNMIPLTEHFNKSKGDKQPEVWLVGMFGHEKAQEILAKVNAYFEWLRK